MEKKYEVNKISAVLPLKRFQQGYDEIERANLLLIKSLKKFFKLDDKGFIYCCN